MALFNCCHAEKIESGQKCALESQAETVDPKDVSSLQSGDSLETSAILHEDVEAGSELSGEDGFVLVDRPVHL